MKFQSLFLRLFISIFVVTIVNIVYISSSNGSEFQSHRSFFYKFKNNTNSSQPHSIKKRFLIFQGAGVLKICSEIMLNTYVNTKPIFQKCDYFVFVLSVKYCSGSDNMVLGFSEPLNFLSKVAFRQLAVNYAFHLQYSPPTVPVYWWTYFYNSLAWSNGPERKLHTLHRKSIEGFKYYFEHHPNSNRYKKLIQGKHQQTVISNDTSRIAVYKAIESVFNSKGFSGEKCLLRTICEISHRSLYEENSLHRIINAIFIPVVENTEKKFFRAKNVGGQKTYCKKIYRSCEDGIRWLQNIMKYTSIV